MKNLYPFALRMILACALTFLISVDFHFAYAQGFTSVIPLTPLDIDAGAGTTDKSQSKVFFHDGKYWSVLANSSGTQLWRLDGLSWTHIRQLTTRKGRADCKVIGNVLHVFIFQQNVSQCIRPTKYMFSDNFLSYSFA